MARIRTIKPEFFSSADICELSPVARLLYISFWCEADREGRLEWKPKTFKLRYFPADNNKEFDAAITELSASDLIEIYEIEGKIYCQIPTFTEHQVINNRESDSIIPEKPLNYEENSQNIDASIKDFTRESGVKAEGRKEGREGKGKEGAQIKNLLNARFEEFYSKYPKKIDKKKALAAFNKIKPDDLKFKRIMRGLEKQIDWRNSARGQFIPEWKHPTTWLNGDNWDDAMPQEKVISAQAFDDWDEVK